MSYYVRRYTAKRLNSQRTMYSTIPKYMVDFVVDYNESFWEAHPDVAADGGVEKYYGPNVACLLKDNLNCSNELKEKIFE